jgi:hypothetical protein
MRLMMAVLIVAPLAALPQRAAAHHGWSGYDATELVTLTGTVESIAYASPHVLLMLEAEGKLWEIVLAPPSRMQLRGLPDGAIRTGEPVTVEGYPHRSDPDEFRAERIGINGQSFELR